jgi:hypothetical protein
MNILLHLALLVCLIPLVTAEDKINVDKNQHHIYLLIGQSNMAGRAAYSEEDTKAIPNAFLFDDKDNWQEATNPLNRYSTIRKDLKVQRMGPGYSFAQIMASKGNNITIGLVVNAKGGTRIAQWEKGTDFFNDAVSRTKKAMKTGTLKGILWHQGEADQKNKAYIEQLSKLVTDFREALGQSELPFVAGEIRESGEEINKQINELTQKLKNTGVASSKDLKTFDGTHFDVASAKILGSRFAEEMSKLIK